MNVSTLQPGQEGWTTYNNIHIPTQTVAMNAPLQAEGDYHNRVLVTRTNTNQLRVWTEQHVEGHIPISTPAFVAEFIIVPSIDISEVI